MAHEDQFAIETHVLDFLDPPKVVVHQHNRWVEDPRTNSVFLSLEQAREVRDNIDRLIELMESQ